MKNPFDRNFLRYFGHLIAENYWVLFLLAGIIFLAIGTIWQNEFFTTLGTTIVASGVFSAITSSRIFSKIYASVLHDIVYGEDFLRKQKDVDEIWKRVSSVLCDARFPSLKEKIDDTIINDYLPKTRNFYYKEVSREYTIKNYDANDNSILCEDRSVLTIVPHSDVQNIQYSHKFRPSSNSGSIESETFEIDGVSIRKPGHFKILQEETDEDGFHKIIFELPPGEHKILRVRETKIPLCPEPYSKVTYNTYAETVRIHAKSEAPEIRLKLVDKDLFNNIENNAEADNRVSVENKTLVMPGQSHLLLYSVKKTP